MITTKELFNKGQNLDDKSLGFLIAAIEKNNLPGFDYYEFKRAVASLVSMNLEEEMAHKSAFATAATVGLTKEKLIETAKYYREVLEKERVAFKEAAENQQETRIAAKETETQRLEDQVLRHKEAISRMQDELAGYLQQIDKNKGVVEGEKAKLQQTEQVFDSTLNAVLFQIDTDIENMHKFI